MTSIILKDVYIELPIYTSRSVGLINTIFQYAQTERRRIESIGQFSYLIHALRGIDLEIHDGERVALVGRNGAGKTTLLRVLSGAYEPTRGSLKREGSVTALTNLTLGMDMDASGYDNIRMRAIYLGFKREETKKLTVDVEEFTELGEHLMLPVRTYSSGMLLRLAFALSLSSTAEILLMDEMISAGDAHFVEKAQARLSNKMREAKILVLASHHEDILSRFCSRGVYLKEGRIVFDGDLAACLETYHSEEVVS